jgi:DNA-directed RNA polymerase specialized sigma24 family protein
VSEFVEWISAAGDGQSPARGTPIARQLVDDSSGEVGCGKPAGGGESWQELAVHNFPARLPPTDEPQVDRSLERTWDSDPDIWLYRKKTTALLRRYMRWSLEAGRVPSVLGRELFRAKITAFTATTFEARVIFLHDVERCLDRLQDFDRQIIARVCLQEYDHEAAARILQCTRRTLLRRLPELIDELSEAFLKAELLERIPETREERL